MKSTLKRRSFLKGAAGISSAAIFGGLPFSQFAKAAELAPADRCFVFVYFSGGWDVLLSLDPKDPAVFTAERMSETRIFPGYNLLPGAPGVIKPTGSNIDFGPAIGKMQNHWDKMAIVRGINMNTVAHDVGYRYFLTGKEPNGNVPRNSSTAVEIVAQMKPRVPVPNIAYGIETFNDRHPGFANALKVGSSSDLLLTLSPSPTQIDSEIENALIDLNGQKVSCEAQLYDSRGLKTQYQDARLQMKDVLAAQLNKAFDFSLVENAAVRAQYGLSMDKSTYNSPAGRAAMVATALKRGVSQCVSLGIGNAGLDTHFGSQAVHAANQKAGWDALGDLVSDLKMSAHPGGGTFMDKTTIVVFSEFSRTPLINASNGRDHHITNSCMLLGAGIKPNTVFGKSGDVGMSAGLVNHNTGLPDANGFEILPDHIVATVLASAKLDYRIMRVNPLAGLLAP
jgi:uncharacterized protein (DUF1501 family)